MDNAAQIAEAIENHVMDSPGDEYRHTIQLEGLVNKSFRVIAVPV